MFINEWKEPVRKILYEAEDNVVGPLENFID